MGIALYWVSLLMCDGQVYLSDSLLAEVFFGEDHSCSLLAFFKFFQIKCELASALGGYAAKITTLAPNTGPHCKIQNYFAIYCFVESFLRGCRATSA